MGYWTKNAVDRNTKQRPKLPTLRSTFTLKLWWKKTSQLEAEE